MTTEVLHQYGQARSTKIWNDRDGYLHPARVLRGFLPTFTALGGFSWRLTLSSDADGAAWISTAMLPNGLLVKITHQTVGTIDFFMNPLAGQYQYLVIRCAWAQGPLSPTYVLLAPGATPTGDELPIGVVSTGFASPVFYSLRPDAAQAIPVECVGGGDGVGAEINFGYPLTLLPAAATTEVNSTAVIPRWARRWRNASGTPTTVARVKVWVQIFTFVPPAASQLEIDWNLYYYRHGQATTFVSGSVTVDATGWPVGESKLVVDAAINLTTLLGSVHSDWSAGTTMLTVRRPNTDTLAVPVFVCGACLELCRSGVGAQF